MWKLQSKHASCCNHTLRGLDVALKDFIGSLGGLSSYGTQKGDEEADVSVLLA